MSAAPSGFPWIAQSAVRGPHVLLVDDVFTTGATLEACARALKRAGAARVLALTLARVVRAPLGRYIEGPYAEFER